MSEVQPKLSREMTNTEKTSEYSKVFVPSFISYDSEPAYEVTDKNLFFSFNKVYTDQDALEDEQENAKKSHKIFSYAFKLNLKYLYEFKSNGNLKEIELDSISSDQSEYELSDQNDNENEQFENETISSLKRFRDAKGLKFIELDIDDKNEIKKRKEEIN
eukprot:gene1995-1502_t